MNEPESPLTEAEHELVFETYNERFDDDGSDLFKTVSQRVAVLAEKRRSTGEAESISEATEGAAEDIREVYDGLVLQERETGVDVGELAEELLKENGGFNIYQGDGASPDSGSHTTEEPLVNFRMSDLTCPVCLEQISGQHSSPEYESLENQIRTHAECSECEAPLYVVIENLGDDEADLNAWVMERDDE